MSDRDLNAFLKQNGFVGCPEYSLPEKGMGSWVDAFRAGDILLRVVVDRGQRYIDLACTDTNIWTDVFTLVSKIDVTFKVRTGSFSESVRVLISYWPNIFAVLVNKRQAGAA